MNKLNPEDLHLLIDEPIYLLDDHVIQKGEEEVKDEVKEDSKVEEPVVELAKPKTTKNIIVISESNISSEDEIFLFKGLNALDITKDDISILNSLPTSQGEVPITHKIQIIFNDSTEEQKLYNVIDNSGVSSLACHSLNIIRNDHELKKKFWFGLKALFGK